MQKIAIQQAKTNNRKIPDPITVTAFCVPIPIWAPPLLSVSSCNFSPPSSILASPSQEKFIYHIGYIVMLMVHTYGQCFILRKHPFAEINRLLNLDTSYCNIYFLWLSSAKWCFFKVPHKIRRFGPLWNFQVLTMCQATQLVKKVP